eukprot:TRINITY_DN72041_c0_g1_i1.p1 TRINITY_DN72041_c0_g1~~TRINITY_DN72041_c0_g1_i1.p1  ORF type:complete len:155 (+),score=32.81 TRINITY_DN72041_c0_g1_i1:59-523(+)
MVAPHVLIVLTTFASLADAASLRQASSPPWGRMMVALDKDLKTKMLVQVSSAVDDKPKPVRSPACSGVTCGELKCPTGFQKVHPDGACCPYCVDPDLGKIQKKIKGATGEFGGEKSSFCENVWCFPTLCKEEVKQPTSGNGQCCAECNAEVTAR